jgi:hypothetical protein
METSGTFVSDLKKDVLNTELFKGMVEAGERSGDMGDTVLVLGDSLLDYILACIDSDKAKDFPHLAQAVGQRHIAIMAHIITCCKPN